MTAVVSKEQLVGLLPRARDIAAGSAVQPRAIGHPVTFAQFAFLRPAPSRLTGAEQ